jgi:two-component sensor histidine kinase
MSFIHESLYLTNDFARIDFGEYLESLTKNLIHTYGLRVSDIRLDADIESICLGIDQAIPCGLIVNEIISNALKYAFPNKKDGMITLRLKLEDNEVLLGIGDNGIGLPNGFDYTQAESLGLQLVHTLIEQLDATIKLDNEGGTRYLITFAKQ